MRSVWLSAGVPLNCELHNVMKDAENQYHYQIRKLKRSENLIKKNRLLDACIINRNGDLFTEIKNLRKHITRLRLRFIADALPISLLRLAYEYSTEKTYSGHQSRQHLLMEKK